MDVFDESREFTKFQVDLLEERRESFTAFQVDVVEDTRRELMRFQVDVVEPRRDVTRRGVQYDDRNRVEACFQRTLHLLSLAVVDVAKVKAFLGRWKALENRLLQLPALLHEMSQLRCLSSNRVCTELLKVMEAAHSMSALHAYCISSIGLRFRLFNVEFGR